MHEVEDQPLNKTVCYVYSPPPPINEHTGIKKSIREGEGVCVFYTIYIQPANKYSLTTLNTADYNPHNTPLAVPAHSFDCHQSTATN